MAGWPPVLLDFAPENMNGEAVLPPPRALLAVAVEVVAEKLKDSPLDEVEAAEDVAMEPN